MLFPAKPLKEPYKKYKTVKINDNCNIYTFSGWKAWKRLSQHRYIKTLQLKVATKNPFQCKIMT